MQRADASEQLIALLGAVAVCGATSSAPLTQLDLTFVGLGNLRLPSWAGQALGRLRRLVLTVVEEMGASEGLLEVLVPLSPLSELAELDLHAHVLHLAPHALLPPSLTQLYLGGLQGPSLPDQVARVQQGLACSVHGLGCLPISLLPAAAGLRFARTAAMADNAVHVSPSRHFTVICFHLPLAIPVFTAHTPLLIHMSRSSAFPAGDTPHPAAPSVLEESPAEDPGELCPADQPGNLPAVAGFPLCPMVGCCAI